MAISTSRTLLIFFCLGIQAINEAQAQQCILAGNGNGLPDFRDYRLGNGRIIIHHQAIIPSYSLVDCDQLCGNITEWGVDVFQDQNSRSFYTLDLQVWRPSPTMESSTGTGCYSLVGNNRFTSIPLNDRVALVTPSPQDYIQFQPGDVLGFYVEEARDSVGVVVLTEPSSFTSELVWYASIAPTMATSQNGDCPYSVGSNGVLDTLIQAAPVISISTVTFPCPSMATTQPTPQPPNPTTDSEEAPPTTNRQTQEPVDPNQTTDSEGATGTELRVPTTSETATDLPIQSSQSGSTNIGLIIGSAAAGLVVIILSILTVVIVVAVLLKKHMKTKKEGYPITNVAAVPTTTNEAYGLACHDHSQSGVEENIYNFPEVSVHTIEAKQNEAYVTHANIATAGNRAYGTNNIVTTETNSAYGQIEIADEYDYI